MGVQDFVARFGEQGVYPGIEGDGLLRGVDAARLYRGQGDPLAGQVKIRPGQFKGLPNLLFSQQIIDKLLRCPSRKPSMT